MQDDQITKPDDPVKNAEDSVDGNVDLTLGGSPPSDSSIPDPALDALNQNQDEQSSDASPAPVEETASASTAPESKSADEPAASPAEVSADSSGGSPQSDSILDPIKKEALQKLEPLVSELDLHPEEKYRALMMIIQATDNKDLVNEAFQAADKIEDNKTRAQALLSIVNEIEYFKNKEIASGQ
jgi:hypothetical protein